MLPCRLITRLFKRSFRQEDGAVTVDWVVLTAAVVGLTAALFNILQDPVNGAAISISNKIAETN